MEIQYFVPNVIAAGACAWYAKVHGRNPWIWGLAGLLCHVFACAALLFVCRRRKRTLQQYLAQYPQCATGKGISCAVCGSKSIRLWVRGGLIGHETKHLCNHCGTHLYSS